MHVARVPGQLQAAQRFLLALALLIATAVGTSALAAEISIYPLEETVCTNAGFLFQNKDVRIVVSNLPAGKPVKIHFSHRAEGDDDASDPIVLHEGTADGDSKMEAIVTIPAGYSTPALGYMESVGASPSAWSNVLFWVVSEGTIGEDSDGDGVPDLCDNCAEVPNADQVDSDYHGGGDACDVCPRDSLDDSDGDGLCSDVDPFPYDADNDKDGDGRDVLEDNCPDVYNPVQLDRDRNGIGDACQTAATCSDGIDNDEDGFTDFPSDKGCSDKEDTQETSPDLPCDDGLDNDTDALVDYRPKGVGTGDPGCGPDTSLPEDPECDDRIDNDGDDTVDWDGDFGLHTPDPDCRGVGHNASEG